MKKGDIIKDLDERQFPKGLKLTGNTKGRWWEAEVIGDEKRRVEVYE